jgi:hypothetical protein
LGQSPQPPEKAEPENHLLQPQPDIAGCDNLNLFLEVMLPYRDLVSFLQLPDEKILILLAKQFLCMRYKP